MNMKLEKNGKFPGRPGPLLLVIMDGIGIGPKDEGNAVFQAQTPNLDALMSLPLSCRLKAHGPAVGLPTEDDMGNSEVGHNAFGAGRIFPQGAKLVNIAIDTGRIFTGKTWQKITASGQEGGTIHFIGLLSDGNVHSHIDHLFALLNQCARQGIPRVRVHVLLDGRDVGAQTALDYIKPLEKLLAGLNTKNNLDYRIASGGGRMVTTMDRYGADWSIVERGWKAHVLGEARQFGSAAQAIQTYYDEGCDNDQNLDPFVVVAGPSLPVGPIQDGDSVVLFNFRGDRAIEICRAFTEKNFDRFDRRRLPQVFFAGIMQYDGDLKIPAHYLVEPPAIDHTISQYLCATGVSSFAISETQKFGHVTYFWNGNRADPIDEDLETYLEIPSDRISFDKAPLMKAPEIMQKTIEFLETGKYRFGRINFANGDMVGHTGVLAAAIQAVEAVDRCLGPLKKTIEKLHGLMVVTADHGNAEEMLMKVAGKMLPKTSHTLNPVPFIIYDPLYRGEYRLANIKTPGLTHIAATLLNLLGLVPPADYDPSLIEYPAP